MTSASEVLRSAFDHHVWATLGLIDVLGDLDPSQLDSSIDGTYGSIVKTMTHLVDADDRYLQRMVLATLPPYEDHRAQELPVLRERMDEHAVRWNGLLDDLDAGTLHARIEGRSAPPEGYPNIDHAEGLLFGQALHHGDDHRAQICSTLGALGLEVPDLDVWSYWAAERADR